MRPVAPVELGSDGSRAVLHIDMDAFFVAVELRRRPSSAASGGGRWQRTARGGGGGSYEARRYGVSRRCHRSPPAGAAPTPSSVGRPCAVRAGQPAGARDLPVGHAARRALALDEAFLDVSGSIRCSDRRRRSPTRCANASPPSSSSPARWRSDLEVHRKLASRLPSRSSSTVCVRPGRGVWLVAPVRNGLLAPVPSRRCGARPATLARIERFGVHTSATGTARPGDLDIGSRCRPGQHLHDLSWARDERDVESERETKSIGHEETFTHDRHTPTSSCARSSGSPMRSAAGCVPPARRADGVAEAAHRRLHHRRSIAHGGRPDRHGEGHRGCDRADAAAHRRGRRVRLLGVSVSGFGEPAEQLTLDDLLAAGGERPVRRWVAASGTIDAIRERFGARSIGRPARCRTRPPPGASRRTTMGPDQVTS